MITISVLLIIALGALSIAYGVKTSKEIMALDAGSPRMQEIANAILWLLSGEASYATGAILDVGGAR